MTMRIKFFGILACAVSLLLCVHNAAAQNKAPAKEAPADAAAVAPGLEPGTDYVCEAEIYYIWKPAPPPPKPGVPDTEPPAENTKDFFAMAGDQGLVEEEVKNRLNTKIPQMQQQAMSQCVELHQDQTACISSKMKIGFAQISRLDFAARRAMADAISNDCERQLGRCLSTAVSEPKCHLNRPPDMPVAAPAAEAGKAPAKDAKKK